eukprot:gene33183-40945_t
MEQAEHWVKSVYKISESIRRKQVIKKSVADCASFNGTSGMNVEHSQAIMAAAATQRSLYEQHDLASYTLNDNDCLANIESTLSRSQLEASEGDINSVGWLSSFEGMIQCSYLRGYFQKYLMTHGAEECLLFWEYAEDFRRGHPFALQDFGFVSAEGGGGGVKSGQSRTVATLDVALYVLHWAENIYNSFAEACAFYQVGGVTDTDEMLTIYGLIKENKASLAVLTAGGSLKDATPPTLSCDLFVAVQSHAFNSLKHKHYPEFTRQGKYSRLLRASLNAHERSHRHLNLLSSFLHSDAQSPADRGVVPIVSKADKESK